MTEAFGDSHMKPNMKPVPLFWKCGIHHRHSVKAALPGDQLIFMSSSSVDDDELVPKLEAVER